MNLKKLLSSADFHMQELLHGSAVAIIIKLLAAGMVFGLNVVLARLLGADGSGVFFLSFTIVMIAAVLGRIGMENALVRFIAINMVANRPNKVIGVYFKAMKFSALVAIPLSILLFSIAPWLSYTVFHKPELERPLMIMAFSVAPVALFMLHAYALQGLKRIAASITILSLSAPSLTIVLSMFFAGEYGIQAASHAYLIAALFTLGVGWLLWNRATSSLGSLKPVFNAKELLSSSMPLYFVSIATLIVGWAPLLILGAWESNADVGIFSAAFRTASLISFILVAVNSIAAPKFAELYQKGDMVALGGLARNATKLMMMMSFPALLLCVLFPEYILGVFGDEFKQGSLVLIVLSVGQFINVSTGAVGYLLIMSGHEKLMGKILVFSAFCSILISFLLIPYYGALGAAIGSAIVISMQNLIAMAYVWRKLGVLTFPYIMGTD